ncbi:MAG TPA: hypothetical protein EYQ00_04465, partial [Dehalococcoidia bacterium]|nr:hypothetical protein [Dehalococcoidia bacterium]
MAMIDVGDLMELALKHAPAINRMIAKLANPSGDLTAQGLQIQAVCDKIMTYLFAHGLCYKERVPSEFVGVHPDNRSKAMLDILNVQKLLCLFIKKG